MKGLLPIVASLLGGFALGYALLVHFNWQIPIEYAPYISVAALAGLDTLFGGIRAGVEGRFQNDVFATGFVLNSVLAWAMAWFGDHIGVNLAFVAVFVLGVRIFNNLSLIRRFYLNKLAMARRRVQEESQATLPLTSAPQYKSEIGGNV